MSRQRTRPSEVDPNDTNQNRDYSGQDAIKTEAEKKAAADLEAQRKFYEDFTPDERIESVGGRNETVLLENRKLVEAKKSNNIAIIGIFVTALILYFKK
tara:strand:+ start:3015 stop:3311 length:297 start_codon:yes stop_codon:yes gene_type:complete